MHIYSKAVENAVCILTYLARQQSGSVCTAQQISKLASLSSPTVAKTLQQLAKAGMVESRKGPGGGFCLNEPPEQISLKRIIVSIEGVEPFSNCLAGHSSCEEENICPLHDRWKPVKGVLEGFLVNTTLKDLACAMTQKELNAAGRGS